MSNYSKIVRSNILAEFGRKDIYQARAAEWINISPAAFGFRLNGKTDFRLGELVTLAEQLQVPFSTLVHGLDEVVAEHHESVAS
ncbi:hypothetical protein [Glutamicibacter sp. AOP5-A2-18]|uniref:hypothetical protein n=1 Tax=Glutamicibacter sp. AOP5-A2-18 TaxID=3457656 RepID=UPI0040347366